MAGVLGLAGLRRDMAALPRRIDRAIAEPIERLAREILAEALARCPVATGALRDTLRVVEGHLDDAGTIVLGSREGRSEWLVIAGDESGKGPVMYAAFVEFGTSSAPARPFLRPAIEAVRSRATREVADAVAGVLKAGSYERAIA